MAKKRVTIAGVKRSPTLIVVRNVDRETWTEFRALAERMGRKLGPLLTEALNEKIDREKQ